MTVSIQLPDPRYMDWVQWSAQATEGLRGASLYIVPEDDWRDWAYFSINSLPLNQTRTPDPAGYANWQDWASELIVATAGGL